MIPKFRAWDKKKKKFIRLSALHIEESGENVGLVYDMSEHYISTAFSVGGGRSLNLIDGVLMQLTGLKDLNSIEIFEGDILFDKHHNPQIGVVVFYEGAFQLLANNMYYPLIQFDGDVEIIGNIHENPELLEEASEEDDSKNRSMVAR